MRTVGQNIKEIRTKQGLTQEFIAYKLNISQNAFSKIELGYTDPTITRIRQIAKVLDVTAVELIIE